MRMSFTNWDRKQIGMRIFKSGLYLHSSSTKKMETWLFLISMERCVQNNQEMSGSYCSQNSSRVTGNLHHQSNGTMTILEMTVSYGLISQITTQLTHEITYTIQIWNGVPSTRTSQTLQAHQMLRTFRTEEDLQGMNIPSQLLCLEVQSRGTNVVINIWKNRMWLTSMRQSSSLIEEQANS